MCAVLLTGHGGFDRLEYRTDVPVPRPGAGEVLIRVAAAGVNNTDINTRTGWYSKAAKASGSASGDAAASDDAAGASWTGSPLRFPRIQGADCCGHIVAVGEGVARSRIGKRVIVAPLLRHYRGFRPSFGISLALPGRSGRVPELDVLGAVSVLSRRATNRLRVARRHGRR